jgi:hypothetical protein
MNAVIIEDENLIARELMYKIAETAPDVHSKRSIAQRKDQL